MLTVNNFYNLPTPLPGGDKHTQMTRAALDRYQWAHIKGQLGVLLGAVMGRTTGLTNLESLKEEGKVSGCRYVGIRTVSLRQIVGSEGRSADFDRHFNPIRCHTQQRWLNVMLARMLHVPLPPVQLIRVGEAYFVRDGHHRISVAQALGEDCIEAEVTVWELAQAPLLAARPAIAKAIAA
jgi:hypothetical protein